MDELKKVLEQLQKTFEEFKTARDAEIKEIKAKGAADPLLVEKVEKLNAALSAQDASRVEIEKKLNRLVLGAGGNEAGDKVPAERKAFSNALRTGAERLSDEERKALVVANDTSGGFLSPTDYVMEIIKAEVLWSPMRQLVSVRPTGRSSITLPKRTQTAAATRVGEVETRSEGQNPKWGSMEISAPEMYAEARISMADLEDAAFDLEAILRDEFSEQFGVKEGAEVISGNGINACLGFLDANAAGPSTPIAYTASGQAATIAGAAAGAAGQGDPLIDLIHAVKTPYAVRGTFVLNRGSLGKVRKLKDTTGAYLWQPGLNGAASPTICGAPYVECPDMPDEGANAFPIAFGDWKRAYVLVDRVEMSIVRDPYTVASSGQVKFTARRRVGGQVVLGEAIRLLKCATS